jgi:hypothetical protein
MKLKTIKDGMVVHCKTEDEAKELIKWAYECGYTWGRKFCAEDTFYEGYKENTCYFFWEDKAIGWGDVERFERRLITEFTDLIISEEQEKKRMSAEAILAWLKKYDYDKVMADVFSYGDVLINNIDDVLENYKVEKIVEMIEAYESKKKQEKKTEIVWRFRTFSTHEMEAEMFSEEKDAIKWCEDMSREFPSSLNSYAKTCLLKEFLPDVMFSDMT